jgi:hypothetical protein
MESVLPSRPRLRMASELPRCRKSSTAMLDPNREKLRQLSALPR